MDVDVVVGYLVVGVNIFLYVDVCEGDIELKWFYILVVYQNGGYGVCLMDVFMVWLDQLCCCILWVGVWEENFGV